MKNKFVKKLAAVTSYNAKFSINVLNNMPVDAEGQIVILPGVTE